MSQLQLVRDIANLHDNPLGYVLYNYRWGLDDLRAFVGPDLWQIDFLDQWGADIRERGFDGTRSVMPMRYATRAGHGVGKSGLVGWIVNFIMDTRPHCKGIVTANTAGQLATKTWPEIVKWRNRGFTKDWVHVGASRGSMNLRNKQHPVTWRCDAIAWRKEQPEAFQGQHAVDSTSFYVFDEASATERAIFEAADGGLTDGEPMEFLFGNPTRNEGYFYDAFHKFRHLFRGFKVGSREALIPNKEKLQQDIQTYGIDSDYIRVKILGEFPNQSSEQFIGRALVDAARKREERSLPTDPLIMGVDVARSVAGDESVIRLRRGKDARSVPALNLRPNEDRRAWTMQFAGRVAELAEKLNVDAIFVDGGGIGGGVIDRLEQLQVPNVIEVLFGGKSPDRKYKNRGSYMYGMMRDWLESGGAIEDDDVLADQLTGRYFYYDPVNSAIMLEPKDDMSDREGSPDRADALALTFAYPVGPRDPAKTQAELRHERFSVSQDASYLPS